MLRKVLNKKIKIIALALFILTNNFNSVASAVLDGGGGGSVAASKTTTELTQIGTQYSKLEGFKRCANEYLTVDGIDKGDGPFNLSFIVGVANSDKAVGYLVDSRDGRWDCGSSDGTREDAWFRALGYGSWDDNDDESYVNKGPIFVSDDGAGDYYFAETKGVDPSTPETSKTAFIGQINNKIKELTDPLSASEKKALKYQILSEAFFSENGCNAKKSSGLATDSGKDKLKIGEIEYIVNNDGEGVVDGEVAVGHGDYSWGDRGTTNCKSLATELASLYSDWSSVTGEKDQDAGTDPDGADDNTTTEPNCENTSGVTGWVICPIIDGAFGIMRVVEGAVVGQLKFTLDDIGADDTTAVGKIKASHNSLLVTANILFAVGILWIVISQAITGGGGGGFFGAYEAKKILPKLIAGIIVANFSWELVNLLLILTNALGDSIKSIMLAPFGDAATQAIDLGGWSGVLAGGAAIGAVALAVFGFFAVSPILIMIVIAIVAAIMFSILRKAMIIILVTFAPIMLALSPFMPNLFKRYYKLLFNVIFFYVIVMISISACTIIGYITIQGAGNADSIGTSLLRLTGMAFYFGWIIPVLAFAKNNFDVVGKAVGGLQSMGNKAGRQFGQNRLAGNQRRINRETKKQREIGLKKTNAQRRQTGIITRRFDRGRKGQEAYDQEYESSLQSMGVNAGNANLAQKTKARALAEKAKSKAIAKEGLSQKPLNTLRDRTVRGRFNQEDRRAKGAYEAKVAIGGIEEAYKDAEAESEIVFDGMDKSSAQKEAFRIATDFDGHDKYQRRAAIKKLVQLKATNELGRVMDTHMNSTEGSQEWNNLLASDMFTTIKAHDASLTLPYNPGEEQQAQVTAYSGFNSGNLLTMQGEASWARFGESMRYAQQQAQNTGLSQQARKEAQANYDKMFKTARLAQETIEKNPQVLAGADSNAATYLSGLTGNGQANSPDFDYLPTIAGVGQDNKTIINKPVK